MKFNNKKAEMTFDHMIMAVLALFLIVLLLWKTGALAGAMEKFGGKAKEYFPNDDNFVPFDPAVMAADEEKVVLGSMNALRCSLSATATGIFDPSKNPDCKDYVLPKKQDGVSKAISFITGRATTTAFCSDGVLFGSTCMNCDSAGCKLTAFELPQDFAEFGPEAWIQGAQDPEWIVYYEAFPKGEDAAWQISPTSFFTDVIFYGAVLNMIPAVGGIAVKGVTSVFSKEVAKESIEKLTKEGIEQGLREVGETVGKELSEDALREFTELFAEGGYERVLKSELLYREVFEKLAKDEATSTAISRVALERYSHLQRLGKTNPEIVEGIMEALEKDILHGDTAGQLLVRESVEKMVNEPLSALVKESAENQVAIKQYFKNRMLTESGEELSKEALEKMFTKSTYLEVFEKLPAEAQEAYLKKATAYTDELITLEGEATELALEKATAMKSASLLDIKGQYNIFMDQTYRDIDGEALKKVLLGITPGEKTLKEIITSGDILKYSPIQIVPRTFPKGIPLLGGKIAPLPPKIVASLAKSLAATGNDIGIILNTIQQSRILRYSTAYYIGTILAEADSRNEKFRPKGENTLVLSQPFDFERSKKYDMNSIDGYYLNLIKKKDQSARLFFASPCKTDLVIKKTQCSCQSDKGTYLLDGVQPVEGSSIDFNGVTPEGVFYYDSLTPTQKKDMTIKCYKDEYSPANVKGCLTPIRKDPELYNKFMDYVYKNIYISGISFIKNNDVNGKFIIQSHEFTAFLPRHNEQIKLTSSTDTLSVEYQAFAVMASFPTSTSLRENPFKSVVYDESNNALREEPLSFDKFSNLFNEQIVSNWDGTAQRDDIHNIIHYMNNGLNYQKRKGVGTPHFDDFFSEGNILSQSARKYHAHYYIVDSSKVDVSKSVKQCNTIIDPSKSSSFVLDTKTVTPDVSCLTIEPDKSAYTAGDNYCFTTEDISETVLPWIFNGVAIAIDIGVGMTSWGLMVEAPVMAITGGGAALASKAIQDKWPKP